MSASFRDPSGFVFIKDQVVFRQVNLSYRTNYDLLVGSGLYKELSDNNLLIKHTETNSPITKPAYKILLPEQIPFISYPYEWSFSQLKDAALLTLKIQKESLRYGLSLKDASAYNIQYLRGKPILIDTLSFEKYDESKPWIAYRQFCQHFLAPLSLMTYNDLYMGNFSKNYIDGIPLDITVNLLPAKTKYKFGLLTHLHLHAKSQARYSDPKAIRRKTKFNQTQMLGILDHLATTIKSLHPPKQKTTWGEYYSNTNYTTSALKCKSDIIERYLKNIKPKTLWDAGANDAYFSRLASQEQIFTLASDVDPVAIEAAYRRSKEEKDQYLLPLIIDLTNPSPAIGWANQERSSFLSRCNFDVTLCLAFVHHLAIANNLPFSYIAELFSKTSKNLIIEFVPKQDSKVQHLLGSRDDIFDFYTKEEFEKEFSKYFKIARKDKIVGSSRTLYLMKTL
jgi:hypothetical protein